MVPDPDTKIEELTPAQNNGRRPGGTWAERKPKKGRSVGGRSYGRPGHRDYETSHEYSPTVSATELTAQKRTSQQHTDRFHEQTVTPQRLHNTTIPRQDKCCELCGGLISLFEASDQRIDHIHEALQHQLEEELGGTQTHVGIQDQLTTLLSELETLHELLRDKLLERSAPAAKQTIPGVGYLPDSQIQGDWKKLWWNLRRCVDTYVVVPSFYSLHADDFSSLGRITSNYSVLLRSKGGCVDLVQAVIWDILAGEVFGFSGSPSRALWAGRRSDQLAGLSKSYEAGGDRAN